MASFQDHMSKFFRDFPELDTLANREVAGLVHSRMDQFAHFPREDTVPRHRRFLHHAEGIEYFAMAYGELARRVAEHHVTLDCGHVPHAIDYYTGLVDEFGCLITKDHPQARDVERGR